MTLLPLKTDRLDLVPFSAEIADEMFAGLQASEIYKYIADGPPPTADALRERYRRLALGTSPDGSEKWLNWALRVSDSDAFVGYVQATVRGQTALLGYVLFPRAWGKGYAGEALSEVLRALSGSGTTEFVATVHTENQRSIRLLERAGFTLRKHRLAAEVIRGLPTSEYEFALVVPLLRYCRSKPS